MPEHTRLPSTVTPSRAPVQVLSWDGLALPRPVPVCLRPEPLDIQTISLPMRLPKIAVRSYPFRATAAPLPPRKRTAAHGIDGLPLVNPDPPVAPLRPKARIKPPVGPVSPS